LAAAAFQAALVKWLKSLPEGRLQAKLAALQDAFVSLNCQAIEPTSAAANFHWCDAEE
jgi:hypothetical protein